MPIKFEFAWRDTPQRSYLSEVSFATLVACGGEVMSATNIPVDHGKLFLQEAFRTSSYLDGLVLIEVDGVIKPDSSILKGNFQSFLNV